MSSKKRVSVFARLGPAGPISQDEAVPSHRRYSTDKHLEKGHHPHPLPPPPHTPPVHTPHSHSHTHSASREDNLRDRERERERKPSHQDYEEKKHYRDAPSQPLPSSSRHRSHKHYHDDPHHLEYPDEAQGMSRSEKRSSLSSPLSLPPPPPPRKSRDLADRLSPTGKDILSKPFMGYEDKLSKLSRSSSSSDGGGRGAGGGGGKGKKTTPPGAKRGSPPEGGTGSEGEAGEGDDSRRKRPRTGKKPKLETGGHVSEDVSRRLNKPLPGERDREPRERGGGGGGGGGKEKTERERHGWPDKPPSSSSVLAQEGGGGEGKDGRARVERGGRPEEREGRRKREEDWPESRELARKRKREHPEEDCTPPPDNSKRVRTADYSASSSSKEHPDTRQTSESGGLSSRDDKHPHLAKEIDPLERKRRYDASTESGKETPPAKKPRSGESTSSSRKYSRTDLTSASAGVRKKTERHHKERSEQEQGGPESEEGDGGKAPKLDWSTISSLSLPKPKPPSTLAVQRFSPGAIFSRLGVSRSLAGTELYRQVSSAVSKHLATEQETLCAESGNTLPEALLEEPFGDSEFAMTGVSRIRNAKENCSVCVNIGPHRRALLASADFSLRRKLGKSSKDILPPSASSATWNPEHFARASLLYNSLGTKASGKPAFRLEPSEVGSLLIPK